MPGQNEEGRNVASAISGREIAIIVALVIAIVVAVFGIYSWKSNEVPGDAAAKVNDTYITESEVAEYMDYFRSSNSLTDDSQWAAYLISNNDTPYSIRQEYLDSAIQSKLIVEKATELNLLPTDEEIDEQLQTMKSSSSFNSDEIWQGTLESAGTSEEEIKEQIKSNLAKQNLFKQEVSKIDATDDQTLAYVKSTNASMKLRHSYRIVFTEDIYDNSSEVYSLLEKAKKAGKLNAEYFQKLADKYSNSDTVSQDHGNYGWCQVVDNSDDADDTYVSVLSVIKEGSFSKPQTIENSDLEIIYCDDEYTFPNSSDISSITKDDVPDSLWTSLKDSAGSSLYDTACNAYLSNLFTQASITYYPIPEGASYNVDMNLSLNALTTAADDD